MTLLIQRIERFPSHHLYSAVKVTVITPAAPCGRTLMMSLWEVDSAVPVLSAAWKRSAFSYFCHSFIHGLHVCVCVCVWAHLLCCCISFLHIHAAYMAMHVHSLWQGSWFSISHFKNETRHFSCSKEFIWDQQVSNPLVAVSPRPAVFWILHDWWDPL